LASGPNSPCGTAPFCGNVLLLQPQVSRIAEAQVEALASPSMKEAGFMKRFASASTMLAVSFLICSAALAASSIPSATAPANTIAKRHMIVAAEPDASEAGREMLRAGGAAVDAAIAAQMVLTLVEPQSSGIGGGSYLVVTDGAAVHAYDGRETAPSSARPDMFLDAQGRPRPSSEVIPGGLSVGVPGTVAVLAVAHKAHGRLPWARLFEPAIRLAEQGFVVQPRLARQLRTGAADFAMMPAMRALFFRADGTPVAAGQTWRNPALAESLKQIAQRGPEAFYRGAIAGQIAEAVVTAPRNPALMTREDIAAYQAKPREPLCGVYRRHRICSVPPSSAGGVTVLQILALLERFQSGQLQPATLSAVHLISEASRLGYADRERWLGDPDFVYVPLGGLLDRGYIEMRSRMIDPQRSIGTALAGMPPIRHGVLIDYAPQRPQIERGTSHLSVVDERGQIVSMTTTIETGFGAQIAAGGFLLNNELTDFSFEPVIDGRLVANAPAPGKRPMSSQAPVIVFGPDGRFLAALGSPGGRLIIAYVAQALVNLIDGQLSMRGVADAPRHVNLNGPTFLEGGTRLEALAPMLSRMGHDVRMTSFDSGVNGIRRVGGGYEGGADPRREGVALGD
jgi:gamma-glutamyltranspeptidase/glutathione hydrolase